MEQNLFAIKYPQVMGELHPTKNNSLQMSNLSLYDRRKVWWQCSNGHEAQISVYTRVRVGCKPCNKERRKIENIGSKQYARKRGSLKDKAPELMKRRDFEKNSAKGIQPTEITQSSNIEVYWRCEHGHEYKRSPKREKKAVHCSSML